MLSKFTTIEEALTYALGKAGKPIPISKSITFKDGLAVKSFIKDDGTVGFEGWISTPDQDTEKDILEPEAFWDGLQRYMKRGAPVSTEHNMKGFPVGYLTKSTLMRDGKPFQEEYNPKQSFDGYRYLDGGTGWYAAGVVYDQQAAMGVVKGTVNSFSWVGFPVKWENIAGGGKRFKEAGSINPLVEATLTAYPINTAATMRIAKAAGFMPKITKDELAMMLLADHDLAEFLVEQLAPSIGRGARDSFNKVVSWANTSMITTPTTKRYI